MKNLSNSLFVECANVAEMRELSNYAKQFPLGGLQPKAIVATSGVEGIVVHYSSTLLIPLMFGLAV